MAKVFRELKLRVVWKFGRRLSSKVNKSNDLANASGADIHHCKSSRWVSSRITAAFGTWRWAWEHNNGVWHNIKKCHTNFSASMTSHQVKKRLWMISEVGLGDKTITICIAIDTWSISIKNVFDKTFDIFYSSSEENRGCEASLVALTKALALW